MKLTEFADSECLGIEIYYAWKKEFDNSGCFYAYFADKAYFFVSPYQQPEQKILAYGEGNSPEEALRDFVEKIKGYKVEVVDVFFHRSKTVCVPKDLTV